MRPAKVMIPILTSLFEPMLSDAGVVGADRFLDRARAGAGLRWDKKASPEGHIERSTFHRKQYQTGPLAL